MRLCSAQCREAIGSQLKLTNAGLCDSTESEEPITLSGAEAVSRNGKPDVNVSEDKRWARQKLSRATMSFLPSRATVEVRDKRDKPEVCKPDFTLILHCQEACCEGQ